ncbi:submaxillary gland androgen-regulated protein 3A-like [Macrobrachium rosenbergii]|uniref:submaxillary gland androgen-regulated protein 3A-like n=1 Tax=Macrobrachium rosenbergii TaxID=79674 RepID=UPI0034D52AA1
MASRGFGLLSLLVSAIVVAGQPPFPPAPGRGPPGGFTPPLPPIFGSGSQRGPPPPPFVGGQQGSSPFPPFGTGPPGSRPRPGSPLPPRLPGSNQTATVIPLR